MVDSDKIMSVATLMTGYGEEGNDMTCETRSSERHPDGVRKVAVVDTPQASILHPAVGVMEHKKRPEPSL